MTTKQTNPLSHVSLALLPVRLVVGWMFFSAFHRRVVLDPGKLVLGVEGYVGEKFNQFMPGSILGVDKMIAWLLDRPEALHAFLWSFTIIEALVGLALMLGLGSRLAALGTLLLSAGILFGAGWLGPTCLDEWQIGAMGIAGGAALMLGGSGPLSLDNLLRAKRPQLFERAWFRLAADPLPTPTLVIASALALLSFGTTLATNQVFHGGLWGKLRNDSVTPRVDVLSARVEPSGDLCMTLERNVGPETYGAFLVDLKVKDAQGQLLYRRSGQQLAELQPKQIMNRWLVRVKPGPHGLVVPLGAQAKLALPLGESLENIPTGNYTIELEDVSGLKWEHQLAIEASPTCSYDGCCRGAA